MIPATQLYLTTANGCFDDENKAIKIEKRQQNYEIYSAK